MSRLSFVFLFLSVGLCSASAQGGHLGTPQEQQACSRDASRFCRKQLSDDMAVQLGIAQSWVEPVKKYSRAMACNGSSIDLNLPIAAIKYGSANPGYPL